MRLVCHFISGFALTFLFAANYLDAAEVTVFTAPSADLQAGRIFFLPERPLGDRLFYQVEALGPNDPLWRAFDSTGSEAGTLKVDIPGATAHYTKAIGQLPNGTYVFNVLSKGPGGEKAASFCFASANFVVDKCVRTNPFRIIDFQVAGDGTLWGFGYQLASDGSVDPESNLLYHFSPDGKLLSSGLSLKDVGLTGSQAISQGIGGQNALIALGAESVALYIPRSQRIFEFGTNGAPIRTTIVSRQRLTDDERRLDLMFYDEKGELAAAGWGGVFRPAADHWTRVTSRRENDPLVIGKTKDGFWLRMPVDGGRPRQIAFGALPK